MLYLMLFTAAKSFIVQALPADIQARVLLIELKEIPE
jgi:hypothetical protein